PTRSSLFPYTTLFRSRPLLQLLEMRMRLLCPDASSRRAEPASQLCVHLPTVCHSAWRRHALLRYSIAIVSALVLPRLLGRSEWLDRKSTRLNSSHVSI